MFSILLINPFYLTACMLCIFVLTLVLRRPRWLGPRWPHATWIAGLTVAGFLYSLLSLGQQFDYKALWALSLASSVLGLGVTYMYRRDPAKAFKIVCVYFTVLFWVLISYKMFQTSSLLDSDERHYLSIAATASGGHGLYPALQNFPPIPSMGGIGHGAWIYVLAYQILGPSLLSLRIVALLVSFLSLPPIFLLFRRWYGPVTGWLAVAILPPTLLYISAFSTRMDLFTITALWWGLLLVDVAREKKTWQWHLVTGVFFGLALQVHIHTSVMTIAVGILYLVDYARQVRQTGRWGIPGAVLAYSVGALMGLGIYIVANILPNPDAYFRTAGNTARFAVVAADANAPLIERLLRSLTAIDVFWTNFVERWKLVLAAIQPVELLLWGAAIVSLFWRRTHKATLPTVVLSLAVLVAGFFILNHYVLIYTTHMGPALLLCVPPFFTYGFSRRETFEWKDVTPALVLVISVCVLPIYITSVRINFNDAAVGEAPVEERQAVQFVKEHVSTDCSILGSSFVFIFDLPMYKLFYSGEGVASGRQYYNFETEPQVWQSLDPDIAIVSGDVLDTLEGWLIETQYEEIFPAVWQKTASPLSANCTVMPG